MASPKNRDSRDKNLAGNGNTKSPAKQSNQLKKWFFTWNNYPESAIRDLETKFPEICERYVFQQEIGKEGTPHIQGTLVLKKKMRFSEFKLPKEIHWEPTRSEHHAENYCQKLDTQAGPIYKWGNWPRPIEIISKLRPWQQEIEDIYLHEDPDNRTVRWYWERIGNTGKSSFCKYMAVKYNILVVQGGKLADLINIIFNQDMTNQKMIIFDVPRNNGNKISYSAIECIKNGMITNTKFETGIKIFNNIHVIIFANQEPDFEMLSEDRWKIKEITPIDCITEK